MKRHHIIAKSCSIFVLCLVLFVTSHKTHAQQSVFTEYEIKAALMYGFIQHIKLAPTTMNRGGNKIRIGILGKDPFGTIIDDMFRGRKIRGRRTIEIIRSGRYGSVRNLGGCQVIFVSSSEASKINSIISFTNNKKILTISDRIPLFCARGGVINFTGNKEEFEFSIQAATQNGMVVSSQLLKLIKNK